MEILLPLLLIPLVVNTIILCVIGGLIIRQIDREIKEIEDGCKKLHAKLGVHTVE